MLKFSGIFCVCVHYRSLRCGWRGARAVRLEAVAVLRTQRSRDFVTAAGARPKGVRSVFYAAMRVRRAAPLFPPASNTIIMSPKVNFRLRLPEDEYRAIFHAAEQAGETMEEYIIRAAEAEIRRDKEEQE